MTCYGAAGTVTAGLSYERDGNRLARVTESVSGSSWTFSYDDGGNLVRDGRTGDYTAVNVLGLTAQVGRKTGISMPSETATYSYLADGMKISAAFSSTNAVQYRGSFVYDPLRSIEAAIVPFGIVLVSGSSWTPYVAVTDHLGSTRAMVNLSSGTVAERNDYYAFGTRITAPTSSSSYPQLSSNRWRYSGKEEQEDVSGLKRLDYGARHYDPFLGSWTSPDPLAEKYCGWSPYAFAPTNPYLFGDEGGMDIVLKGKEGSRITFTTDLIDISADVSSLNINWGGVYTLEGNHALSAALDIIGVFDPYGISDALNATLQVGRGEYWDAAISTLGIIPYLGDLAKGARINKDIQLIQSSIKAAGQIEDFTIEGSGIVYKSFTSRNFRENLIRRTGINPSGKQAHHIFPQKYRREFKSRGIDIDDPKYGVWLDKKTHLSGSHHYNAEWDYFFLNSNNANATVEDIEHFANELMQRVYGTY